MIKAKIDYEESYNLSQNTLGDNSGLNHYIFVEYAMVLHITGDNLLAADIANKSLNLVEIEEDSNRSNFLFEAYYLLARLNYFNGNFLESKDWLEKVYAAHERKKEIAERIDKNRDDYDANFDFFSDSDSDEYDPISLHEVSKGLSPFVFGLEKELKRIE